MRGLWAFFFDTLPDTAPALENPPVGFLDAQAAVAAEVERAMVAGFLSIFPQGCTRDLVEAHAGENWAAAKG